jgi:hypothetical protein
MTEQQLKKGLFRLWIVFSVCWISYFTLSICLSLLNVWERMGSAMTRDFGDFLEYISIIFLPPVILLYLGKSIFWIVKGFKK